jgi:hypothetical protein
MVVGCRRQVNGGISDFNYDQDGKIAGLERSEGSREETQSGLTGKAVIERAEKSIDRPFAGQPSNRHVWPMQFPKPLDARSVYAIEVPNERNNFRKFADPMRLAASGHPCERTANAEQSGALEPDDQSGTRQPEIEGHLCEVAVADPAIASMDVFNQVSESRNILRTPMRLPKFIQTNHGCMGDLPKPSRQRSFSSACTPQNDNACHRRWLPLTLVLGVVCKNLGMRAARPRIELKWWKLDLRCWHSITNFLDG